MPEEPFLSWAKREWLLVVITIGVGLDWLPWLLTPYVPQVGTLSGTKLLVLPGLALACVLRPAWIMRPHVLGVVYLGTLLIGGGLGWLAGTVELGRLTAIGVNGLILLYFLQIRSSVSIRRVLAITFALSFLVPVVQVLTRLGIVTTAWLARLGVTEVPGDTRIFSIFDSTTVGLVPLMIAACLGGLIFIESARHRRAMSAVLAVGLLALGVTSALVAQQRSGILAYAVSFVTAFVLYLASEWKRRLWRSRLIAVFGIGCIVAAYGARGLVGPLEARFTNASVYEGAKELRLGGFGTFLSDLAADPFNPVPRGHQSLLDRTGVEPHLLLSEAYYDGGPLFLAAVVLILIRFARACVALARSANGRARTIGTCLCAFGGGAAIQVSLQTALVLRLVPLVLGVGIAADRAMRVQRRHALARYGSRGTQGT
jgi:hypothetical protein